MRFTEWQKDTNLNKTLKNAAINAILLKNKRE